MRGWWVWAAAAALSLCLLSAAPERTAHLVVLHINDTHGALLPETRADGSVAGGVARVATLARQVREQAPGRVLFLHAGDVLSRGGPLTVESGGVTDLQALEQAGIDVFTPGNGDFYFGLDNLLRVSGTVRVPFIHANIARVTPEGPEPIFASHVILEAAGLRVGVLGLGEVRMDHPSARGLTLRGAAEVARERITELREQVDVLIVLSHLGEIADRMLAASVLGIDLIVGGHSHSKLDRPVQVVHPGTPSCTWIVQAGDLSRFVGRVDIEAEQHEAGWRITRVGGRLMPVDGSVEEAPDIRKFLEDHQERLAQVVGRNPAELPNAREGQDTVGQFAAEAVLRATGAEVALLGRDAFDAGLPAGPVTLADVYRIHPWRSPVLVAQLNAEQIRQAREELDLLVAGAEVTPGQTYAVAVDGFTLGGAPLLREAPFTDSGLRLDEVLIGSIRARSPAGE